MTLDDILNSEDYSPEEKQAFIDYFVKISNGEPATPPLIRRVIRISASASQEEFEKAIADAQGKFTDVSHIDVKKGIADLRMNSDAVKNVIADYLTLLQQSSKNRANKQEELWDIGRFIVASGEDYRIDLANYDKPYPDFILLHGLNRIGLEHTRLLAPADKELHRHLSGYIAEAERYFKDRNSALSFIANISFKYWVPVFNNKSLNKKLTKSEKQEVVNGIVKYIEAVIAGTPLDKPSYIRDVSISNNPDQKPEIVLSEAYAASLSFADLLFETVKKKEEKYSNYIAEAQVNTCWLIVVNDGYSSYSGFDLVNIDRRRFKGSNFGRIILFEAFSNKIIDLV